MVLEAGCDPEAGGVAIRRHHSSVDCISVFVHVLWPWCVSHITVWLAAKLSVIAASSEICSNGRNRVVTLSGLDSTVMLRGYACSTVRGQ